MNWIKLLLLGDLLAFKIQNLQWSSNFSGAVTLTWSRPKNMPTSSCSFIIYYRYTTYNYSLKMNSSTKYVSGSACVSETICMYCSGWWESSSGLWWTQTAIKAVPPWQCWCQTPHTTWRFRLNASAGSTRPMKCSRCGRQKDVSHSDMMS